LFKGLVATGDESSCKAKILKMYDSDMADMADKDIYCFTNLELEGTVISREVVDSLAARLPLIETLSYRYC
jgi:hypothetical protein